MNGDIMPYLLILLVVVVLAVLGLSCWFLVEFTHNAAKSLDTSKEIIQEQARLIDKLVTLNVSGDPMTYQALRAGDSLVGYDNGSSTGVTDEEPSDGEQAYFQDGGDGDAGSGDPFIDGQIN